MPFDPLECEHQHERGADAFLIATTGGFLELCGDVTPGRPLAVMLRQMAHQLLHVGERGQGHDLGDDERPRQRPGPIWTAIFGHAASKHQQPEKKRAPPEQHAYPRPKLRESAGTLGKGGPGRVWQVFGGRQAISDAPSPRNRRAVGRTGAIGAAAKRAAATFIDDVEQPKRPGAAVAQDGLRDGAA